MTRHALLLLLAICCAPAQAQIGRLFFSPAERAQMDAARIGPPPTAPVIAAPTPPPQPLTVSGIVRRSNGKGTVWINGEARAASVHGPQRHPGAIIELDSGRRISVQPGQVVDPQTGAVQNANHE